MDLLRTHYDELLTEKKKAESDRTLAERHMAETRMEAERTAARKRAIEEMENNYEGWTMVEAEQDPAVANPLEYAMKARKYINEVSGL